MKKLQTYRINEENIEELKYYSETLKISQAAIIEKLLDILYEEIGYLEWIKIADNPNSRTPAEKNLLYLAKKLKTSYPCDEEEYITTNDQDEL